MQKYTPHNAILRITHELLVLRRELFWAAKVKITIAADDSVHITINAPKSPHPIMFRVRLGDIRTPQSIGAVIFRIRQSLAAAHILTTQN